MAEDVLQEAALIALRKLDEFDPDTAFAAWMGQIVRYTALNHARRRARQRPAGIDPDDLGADAATAPDPPLRLTARGELPEDQVSFDDEVMAALRTLEDTARACLLLRVVLDLPYREIAAALGIPEGTAMSHVHRARRHLSERLTITGVAS